MLIWGRYLPVIDYYRRKELGPRYFRTLSILRGGCGIWVRLVVLRLLVLRVVYWLMGEKIFLNLKND